MSRLTALLAALTLCVSSASYAASARYQEDDDDVVASESGVARMQVRINQLEEQMRRLQGAVEQVTFENRQLKTQLEKSKGDMDFRLTELEKGGAAAPAPAAAPLAAPAAANDEEEGEPQAAAPASASAAPLPSFTTAHEHYSYAFRLMNQAKYAEAGSAFEAFTKRYPKDALIGNAFYWLGETYYVRKDNVNAADYFRQGYEAMPTGPKAADNLLKLAMALGGLNKDKEACVVLQQVSTKYGKASGSIKARAEQELSRMGCAR